MEKRKLIFISGGARSGKSTFAEKLAILLAKDNQRELHYIATSKPSDDEMKHRISLHKKQRIDSGSPWETWECPNDLLLIASKLPIDSIVLLDCLTLLLTNELFSDKEKDWNEKLFQQEVIQSILDGIELIDKCSTALIIVSNEVLNEPLLDNQLVKTYMRIIGLLHQQIVLRATEAYLVESGIPIQMKKSINSQSCNVNKELSTVRMNEQ